MSSMARMTTRERREARAARLEEWAEKREGRSEAMHEDARAQTAQIPFGQPILVGHHSERGHRAAIDRGWAKMGAAVENDRKASSMASRAETIRAQAAGAIYSDDPDAIEALTAKIARLESEREAIKAKRAAIRKAGGAELRAMSGWDREEAMRAAGAAQYRVTNLGGQISQAKDRLARLQREQITGPRDRMITARRNGKCEDCGAAITAGDLIRYNRQQGARCASCGEEG